MFFFVNLDKLVVASSGEEVLFTDSDTEPELDIKVAKILTYYFEKTEKLNFFLYKPTLVNAYNRLRMVLVIDYLKEGSFSLASLPFY